jgi:hypothetical protein
LSRRILNTEAELQCASLGGNCFAAARPANAGATADSRRTGPAPQIRASYTFSDGSQSSI